MQEKTKEDLFDDIVSILDRSGRRYRKRLGNFLRLKLNKRIWLVYDDVVGLLALESGHYDKYSYGEGFGGKVELFIGFKSHIEINHDSLVLILNDLKEKYEG